MAEYEMQEMNLPNKDGKRILYPRLVQHGQASTDYIAKILSEKSSFTRGDIKGLLQELADELAYQMGHEIGKVGWNRNLCSLTGSAHRQRTGNRRSR